MNPHRFGILALACLTTACGGGGASGPDTTPPPPPPSATPKLALLAGAPGGPGSADGPADVARLNPYFTVVQNTFLDNAGQAFGQGAVAMDGSGNLFVADAGNHTIRKIDSTGAVTTVAGKAGVSGSTDGAAADARFFSPTGVAIDHSGNVFVADSGNNVIRKISTDHTVSTFAGGHFGSADGAGAAASFELAIVQAPVNNNVGPWPYCRGSVAVDPNDNVYVADCLNATIRKITPAGVVSTFAGTAGVPGRADGTGAAASFSAPVGLATDSGGNLYVADQILPLPGAGNLIRMITPGGVVTTVATIRFPTGVAADAAGNIYVTDYLSVHKIAGGVDSVFAGGSATGSADGTGAAASFYEPSSVTTDSAGNVYVLDLKNSSIRKITPGAVVSTFTGRTAAPGSADGAGAAARFDAPRGVAVDSAGNVFVADSENNTVRKVTPAGVTSVFAGTVGKFGYADGSSALFSLPSGVAFDKSGNLFVADSLNQVIRKITPAGVVSTLAGDPSNSIEVGIVRGGSSDGTGSNASFRLSIVPVSPASLYRFVCQGALTVDQGGNIYVADCGNDTIRKVTSAGVVTTIAGSAQVYGSADGADARFNSPSGIAVDSSGNVYVADSGNNTIRKITSAGVSTLAGSAGVAGSSDGMGTAASFNNPQGITVGSSGNLYVADTGNHTIRKITPDGNVTTVLGVAGAASFLPGAFPGLLSAPVGLSYLNGTLYIATENAIAVATAVP